jgi:hypothetical protein
MIHGRPYLSHLESAPRYVDARQFDARQFGARNLAAAR